MNHCKSPILKSKFVRGNLRIFDDCEKLAEIRQIWTNYPSVTDNLTSTSSCEGK